MALFAPHGQMSMSPSGLSYRPRQRVGSHVRSGLEPWVPTQYAGIDAA